MNEGMNRRSGIETPGCLMADAAVNLPELCDVEKWLAVISRWTVADLWRIPLRRRGCFMRHSIRVDNDEQ
jgi:hypothetical protein